MYKDLLLHPRLDAQLRLLIENPPHGLLLAGPAGSGKQTLSQHLAASLLRTTPEKLLSHPYVLAIDPSGDSISIDEIRSLQQFLKLKVPGQIEGIGRAIIITDAHRMRTEAQNALLKTLEEPPVDTVLILTTISADNLLPTITSRVTLVPVLPIGSQQANEYYSAQGKGETEVKQAHALSQGQAGLMHALLNDEAHPLLDQVKLAKQILGLPAGERLLRTDELAKDKSGVFMLLGALQRISHAATMNAATQQKTAAVESWHKKQEAILQAIESLRHNPNLKLLLDNLFLSI